uniref:Uncharacterized protein n=1 Tax=Glossina pallidipes TaxID=7398 RepID=A0A1B0A5Y7_GLOPL
MVRSLAQWTKTLSFPSRLSPNRNSKDCSNLNTNTSLLPPPTPPRNKTTNCATSRSSSSTVSTASAASTNSNNNNTNGNNKMPITELEQIIMHSSVCGPMGTTSKSGSKYSVTSTGDYSLYSKPESHGGSVLGR